MDGRTVIHTSGSTRGARPAEPQDRRVGHGDDHRGAPSVEEEEEEEDKDTGQNEDEDDEEEEEELEMVLSKDDYEMLQAFHRFVPLPALRSKIVRLLCEEDLQVAEDDSAIYTPEEPPQVQPPVISSGRPQQPHPGLKYSTATAVAVAVAKHSPLTRRLSTKSSSATTATLLKPRRQVDLAAQTPRIQRTSTTSTTTTRSSSKPVSIDDEERTG